MNKNDILQFFHSTYSAWGLRHRASKLEESPYKMFLEFAADQIDKGVTDELGAKKAIEYFRTGKRELIVAALTILRTDESDIDKMIERLEAAMK